MPYRFSKKLVLFLGLVIAVSAASAFGEEMEIRASLSGYDLLWPTSRCCAFDLHIATDGAATVVAKVNSGDRPAIETKSIRLSRDQIRSLEGLVRRSRFFALPTEICCGPIHSDERRISVRIGKRSHEVRFSESSQAKQKELARALEVWAALRGTFTIPGENIW